MNRIISSDEDEMEIIGGENDSEEERLTTVNRRQ
jgi:hypothetical protein